jgi:two-component system response regulator AauR
MTQGRGGTAAATVLVVEDDAALRLLCTVNLELDGHRVLEAPTVPVARELVDREEIDVVFLDVHVGGESGYDLIEPIRRRGAPIVLMSGTAEVTAADRERVDAVLSKPFNPEDLSALVKRFSQAGPNG